MRAVVWTTERSWEACVDEAAALLPADAEVTLLCVLDANVEAVAAAGRMGLLGRRPPPREDPTFAELSAEAAARLLGDAAARLGRPARTEVRRGRVEREVVAACDGADLLILARDGERRLGPPSLGKHQRFVVDHARCRVLLVWPDEPPGAETMPPAPGHGPGEGPPGPPPPPPSRER
jgi:nucleotide-binding universal stress UspA family protein